MSEFVGYLAPEVKAEIATRVSNIISPFAEESAYIPVTRFNEEVVPCFLKELDTVIYNAETSAMGESPISLRLALSYSQVNLGFAELFFKEILSRVEYVKENTRGLNWHVYGGKGGVPRAYLEKHPDGNEYVYLSTSFSFEPKCL